MDKYFGALPDPRSEEAKQKDYKHEEISQGEIVVEWKKKIPGELKNFKIRNQDGSSACVAFATAKILGIHEVMEGREYADLSPKFIYTRRQNYPDGGMWLPNALEIARTAGACLESLLPCDNQGEAYMNNKGQETPDDAVNAQIYRGLYRVEIASRNIDEIAKVLQQGYGVLLGFRFEYDEWTEVPQLLHTKPLWEYSVGHGIPAIDYLLGNANVSVVMKDGAKYLMIEDSWGPGFGLGGRRFISEEFLNARCFYAGYITSLPNYIFIKTLKLGSKGLDVKMLQQKLGVKVDGIFGQQTLKAVKEFQAKHGLKVDGIVGPKTNAVLNKV